MTILNLASKALLAAMLFLFLKILCVEPDFERGANPDRRSHFEALERK